MTNNSMCPKIHLPQITGFELNFFDLYTRNPNASISLNKNIFCLIGANGLGKSTFLNTLLYAITAAIPVRPNKFLSPKEYFDEVRRRDGIDDYFDGRISDEYRELATVSCELTWPDITVRLTRPIFELGEISELETTISGVHNIKDATKSEAKSHEEIYQSIATEHTGLKSFEQFVFLWHFVCAFDEERNLLLWSSDVLTDALYLAFGSDIDQERKASELRRKVERLDSRARNTAYAAKMSYDNAKQLSDILADKNSSYDVPPNEYRQYEKLNEDYNKASLRVEQKTSELRHIEAQISDHSATITEIQMEYEDTYFSRATELSYIHLHPLIRSTISEGHCAICGEEDVGIKLQILLGEQLCPLCRSPFTKESNDKDVVKKLQLLDGQMESFKKLLSKAHNKRNRLRNEVEAAEQNLKAVETALVEFRDQYPNIPLTKSKESEPNLIKSEIDHHRDKGNKFKEEATNLRRQRNKTRKELLQIEKELIFSFSEHSEKFIQLFRQYAEQFIGLNVDVELKHHMGVGKIGFELLLNLAHQRRSIPDAVSESQRFFLDIALRMALMEFISEPSGILLIDTPEGSLDISYEAQAGEMFSSFANNGNFLIMTANLRSSELILRLAKHQTSTGMQIERMTEWSDLSDVQRNQEALFEKAYNNIEAALG